MSSTNKTETLGLNQWVGSDVPTHTDFNNDNAILESVIKTHKANTVAHTSDTEKAVWNNPYYIGIYYGNGAATRTITLDIDFVPTWGIIFPGDITATKTDFSNNQHLNYFSIFSKYGGTMGAELDEKSIIVEQSSLTALWSELKTLNANGISYIYIVFR